MNINKKHYKSFAQLNVTYLKLIKSNKINIFLSTYSWIRTSGTLASKGFLHLQKQMTSNIAGK